MSAHGNGMAELFITQRRQSGEFLCCAEAWKCKETHGTAKAEQAGEWQRQGIVFRDIDSEATVLHSIECLHSEGEV